MHRNNWKSGEGMKKYEKKDTISVVIPVYNEEKYIEKLIESLLKQDYDFELMEFIFVDGNSNDNTVEIIDKKLKNKSIEYRILKNEKRLTPISVNMGIKNAKNDIIVRLDAHSEYPENYISKCVYYLNKTGADNVGCLFITRGEGTVGIAIQNVLETKFGVGNSAFRTYSESGYTDTVPYGTFRKSLVNKIGYFNEELIRSEDNEFNYRIIKNGGKVYLFNDIGLIYHPRNTIKGICKMAFENGKWATYTNYIIPGSMKIRHFIPLIFVLGLLVGTIFSILRFRYLTMLFILCVLTYLTIDLAYTIYNIKKAGLSQLLCFVIYPLFHEYYVVGYIFGILKIIKKLVKK